MISIDTPLEKIPRISRKIIPALKRLGILNIRDLLLYQPSRYEDFSNLKKIKDAAAGETVTIRGEIQKISVNRTARKKMFITEARIFDETGSIKALWFNQPFLAQNLKTGDRVSFSGKISLGPKGIYLQNPAYEKISGKQNIHTGGLIAIYPETRGITSRWIRFLIKNFIEFRRQIPDPLPLETRKKYLLPETKDAIFSLHFPKTQKEAGGARRRFNFEQLLLIQLNALSERMKLKQQQAPAIPLNIQLMKEFVSSLPFELTNAQRRSIWEILQDISKPRPMNRLLEGDVGSGKTVVAAAALLLAVKAGYQTAFMAPTEILASQHHKTLKELLASFSVKIGIFTGSRKETAKDTDIFVGTHALIQKNVRFEKLGLIIIDEQHRFGVKQRAELVGGRARESVLLPHLLSMSATPIPRTLALTIYGDLDLSILDEMPKSRKQIITKIVEPGKRKETYDFIRNEAEKGKQIFVICPRIEANGKEQIANNNQLSLQKLLQSEVKAVKEEYKKLSEEIFLDFKIDMLHGKLKSKEKEEIMKKFKEGKTDILVSTSVIEVGVDIPNATIMMIEGAEKFGLAQLYQFRGRVGRGTEQSYCFLFPTEDGMITRRLRAVVDAKNGFELAEKDLEIRGAGDIFGTKQWGVPSTILEAITDAKLVREVRQEAIEILKKDPSLKSWPELQRRLKEAEKTIHPE